MNPSFELPNLKSPPIITVALSFLLVFLPGCAARIAQQQINTLNEQFVAVRQAQEFIWFDSLKRDSKCQEANVNFEKWTLSLVEVGYRGRGLKSLDAQLQQLLGFLEHVYVVQTYMEEKKATMEAALIAMGDLVLPPALPPEIDPFKGCRPYYGPLRDKPSSYQGGKFTNDYVFGWRSTDWREDEQAELKIWEKFLPVEKREPLIRFGIDYLLALKHTLNEREEKGEITILQRIKATNAGGQYLEEQVSLHKAQLNENLIQARAQDNATLAAVAVGLGAVATAALAVNTYENYRIANAQTSMARTMQLQAAQAQAPIQCSYTVPRGYWSTGYVYCY